jgi:hypothetical protein
VLDDWLGAVQVQHARADPDHAVLQQRRVPSVPVQPEDLKVFVTRTGPVHVVHEDESAVSYGASARLDMIDPSRKDAWTVDQVQLTLPDEQSRPTRAIAGSRILQVEETRVGYRIVVERSEEPDPGQTVSTRGA